ncbi:MULTISPECIES: flavin reductase family protein [unclassified Mycolicibacterium]|uniref:flavin reductase family protein n=1 Tax=unclassified Mycolicibacterium TaxID=2636767 RepID=UPI002ED7F3CE
MDCLDITVIDAAELPARKAFGLLKASVVPRPIAWTSTVSPDGVANLAPFSFFTVVSSQPPLILLSLEYLGTGRLKDSAANIEATGEFVVNIAPAAMACAVELTSVQVDAAVDEFKMAKVTPVPCRHVRPPRLAESPISLECRLHTTVQPGSDRLVIGEVLAFHLDRRVLDADGRVDIARLDPLARTAAHFARLQPLFQEEM